MSVVGSREAYFYETRSNIGRWNSAQYNCTSINNTSSLSANYLYAVPCILYAGTKITGLGIYVSTSGSGNARLGIYADSNVSPSRRIIDAGEVSVSTTGAKTITGLNVYINSTNLYWFSFATSVAFSIYRGTALGSGPFLGVSGSNAYTCIRRSFTYAALPDPWGTPALRTTDLYGGGIYYKVG